MVGSSVKKTMDESSAARRCSGKLRREQRAGGKREAERWEGKSIGWEAIKKM